MEALQGLDVAPGCGPGFTAVEWSSEADSMVDGGVSRIAEPLANHSYLRYVDRQSHPGVGLYSLIKDGLEVRLRVSH